MCCEFDLYHRSRQWWDHPEKTNHRNTELLPLGYCKVYIWEDPSLGWRAICWISIIWSLMHIVPVCCIDLLVASLSIGPRQKHRSPCPRLKASCKAQTSFHRPPRGEIFSFGCNSFFSLLDLLTSRVILQLVLSVQPSFLCFLLCAELWFGWSSMKQIKWRHILRVCILKAELYDIIQPYSELVCTETTD